MKGIFYMFIFILMSFYAVDCSQAQPLIPEHPDDSGGIGQDEQDDNESDIAPISEYNSFNIVGVDHFGRTFNTISGYKKDKQVGIFYFLWIGQPYATDIYDNTKILAMPNGLKILTDFNHYNPEISPNLQAHYWGEPIWGYYNSEDEWVIRKQMQMLTIAGVDFLFFDTTNSVIYANVFMKVCEVIDEMLKEGWNPPKVVFYTHSRSFQTVRNLYETLYKPDHYPDTWYRVNGKPLIIAYTNAEDDLREAASRNDDQYVPGVLSQEILDFFHFMKPQWPFDPVYPDGFPWIEWTFPQPLHTESGVMNVTVASHPRVPFSFSLTRPGWINWGRGWNPAIRQNITADVDKGTFIQAQWDHAITVDPPIISVTGYNEWIAIKQPYDGEYAFVDCVNKEYSRDIEPMKGGYQDAFYLQLIHNIRRYKGIAIATDSTKYQKSKTIDIRGDPSQWDDVTYIVQNPDGKGISRDSFGGSRTIRYNQASPTNLLQEIRVTHDADNLYFFLKGKRTFSDPSESNWMNLLIGIGDPSIKEWESYDYIIGKEINGNEISVDRFQDGFNTTRTGKAKFQKTGDIIELSIPRELLNMKETSCFYFKVAMGVDNPSDIMNYYQSGSVMPMGRLSYLYQFN